MLLLTNEYHHTHTPCIHTHIMHTHTCTHHVHTHTHTHSYTLALVRGRASGAPTHYLDHEQKALEVKASTPSDAQFVLCVRVPDEPALLEVMGNIRQSVSHMSGRAGQLRVT